jgi:hypothetical protein
MASLATQPSRSATTPIDRPAGGLSLAVRPGSTNPPADPNASGPRPWAGRSVELTVPNDINFAACDRGQFRSWGPDSVARAHQGPGQRDLVWAVDLTGNGVVSGHGYVIIDAASFPGTPADVSSEIDAILGSIVFGHGGGSGSTDQAPGSPGSAAPCRFFLASGNAGSLPDTSMGRHDEPIVSGLAISNSASAPESWSHARKPSATTQAVGVWARCSGEHRRGGAATLPMAASACPGINGTEDKAGE